MPVCSITFDFRVFSTLNQSHFQIPFSQTPWQYPSNKCSKSLNLISLYAEVSLSITSSEYNDAYARIGLCWSHKTLGKMCQMRVCGAGKIQSHLPSINFGVLCRFHRRILHDDVTELSNSEHFARVRILAFSNPNVQNIQIVRPIVQVQIVFLCRWYTITSMHIKEKPS